MDTFGDILDTLRHEVLRDTVEPYLWRDEGLVKFIAAAHDTFAERSRSLRDSTSDLTVVTLQTGVDLYPLHHTVLSVMSTRIDGDTFDLARVSHPQLAGEQTVGDVGAWLEQINAGIAPFTGRPRAYTTDEGVDGATAAATLRVFPTPGAAEDGLLLRMRIIRLPLVRCTMDTLDKTPECPRQYRWALVHGAAAIAYDMQDADAEDATRGPKQRARFEEFVAMAKAGALTKMHQPPRFGFGRGGFNHS